MFMRFCSDVHLEFEADAIKRGFPRFSLPTLDTDHDTVLVLAGDIALATKPGQYKEFIFDAVRRFKHVIWIMGNHEHWSGSIQRSIAKINRSIGEIDNLSVVENVVVPIGNVDFICATMWTDFANNNPIATMKAQMLMNDYRRIRCALNMGAANPYARKLHPEDTVAWHRASVNFIMDSIDNAKQANRQTVVVTHHAPSYRSIPEHFRGNDLNSAYATSLDAMIESMEPDYWIHGHIHDTQDYNIGHTNILANPRGYAPDDLNKDFDPIWTIDLRSDYESQYSRQAV